MSVDDASEDLGFHIPMGPWCESANARIAELEAMLAEQDRMLRLMTGEYRRVAEIDLIVSDEMVLDDLRARATAPDPKDA